MGRETMTSRERVVRAINRQPVDRVPIDLGSHMSTGISMFAYWNLREELGLPTGNIRIPDMVQGLARVDEDILRRFHCDCILLEPEYEKTVAWNPRGKYRFWIPAGAAPRQTRDGAWVIEKGGASMRMPAGGYFFDGDWISDWGEGSEDDRLALYAKEAKRIFEETEYATNMLGYSHGAGMANYGAGLVDEAVMAYDDPEALHALRKKSLEASLRRMGKIIDTFGCYIQLVTVSDDMGGQNGPMCSPRYIEEFCMPYYARFCEFVHANSDIKVFMHNCGSIKALIPLLIEAGVDVLNPVQISAGDMDPRELKERFGDRICFWGGGCDTQRVLGSGKPEEVRANVRNLVGIFREDSGYVFSQVHNILGDVPPGNIIAMMDAAYEAGFADESGGVLSP